MYSINARDLGRKVRRIIVIAPLLFLGCNVYDSSILRGVSPADNVASEEEDGGDNSFNHTTNLEPASQSLSVSNGGGVSDKKGVFADAGAGDTKNVFPDARVRDARDLRVDSAAVRHKEPDATRDSDRVPVCGNGIREAGEECDGDSGCSPQCKSLITPEQRSCVNGDYFRDLKIGEQCNVCMCSNCTNETETCFASEAQGLNASCAELVRCGYRSGCVGIHCYCIPGSLDDCSYATATGACKDPITKAAGTTDVLSLATQMYNPATALGRANAIGECFDLNCRAVCD